MDEEFYQDGPVLSNQYTSDILLKNYLRRVLPNDILQAIEPDLEHFGERVITDILQMGEDAEQNEPFLVQYDTWGRRIDQINVSKGWKDLDHVSAEEGLVAIGYERKYDEYSRIYQFAKLYLFTPSSAIYTCPLAMTDGAARVIEQLGNKELKERPFNHLLSREQKQFWTSGQWMTEKTGGSDLSRKSTYAINVDGHYFLYGTKWFTSAITSQMAFTLARIRDHEGKVVSGSKGLSLFYLETHNEDGTYNNIFVNRLKDKLGTRALPTAELELKGTKALLIGEQGRGVKNISIILNITRVYNALSSVSYMRRGLALAKDYAYRREAFGKPLARLPLHLETLSELETEFQGAFQLTFYVVELLGKSENNKITPQEEQVLRFLTPITKLFTAKQAITVVSEILECFGGIGYIEDSNLPKLLRDVQVLSIWEGTTNVLALDALRAISKGEAFESWISIMQEKLRNVIHPQLKESIARISKSIEQISVYAKQMAEQAIEYQETGARLFSYSIARITASVLLATHAQWEFIENNSDYTRIVLERWCNNPRYPLVQTIILDEKHQNESQKIFTQM